MLWLTCLRSLLGFDCVLNLLGDYFAGVCYCELRVLVLIFCGLCLMFGMMLLTVCFALLVCVAFDYCIIVDFPLMLD